MKTFEEIKSYIVDFATQKGACSTELRRAKNATSEKELLKVVNDNISWTISNGLYNAITMEDHFGKDLMIEFNLYNTGSDNTGFANTGYRNTGDWNSGYRNTGDWNTGYWNTGDRNTGDWNTGDRNTGYSNTGDWNTGAFCTGETKIKLFNKESDWTHEQFINSRVYQLLCEVDTKLWVYENAMTDEEKQKYPSYKTAEGYLKDIQFKEAFGNRWHNWSEANRAEFTSLPNFDADIFELITGIKVS